ncbi:hypothetical protein POM88_010552 [Heracleum sosnowskyi]|uniref:Retrovirus-related Pol polyprotein from transposon TNT 1-94-like beta-barrel domain-containing protein n=1 Tax=Heracleum sosnowskyi TaxID=360622 RepID=A0AAD8IVC4_9APIA|nr:hypothetical protein POM88_010552 [Heracleum sosnowskyi]
MYRDNNKEAYLQGQDLWDLISGDETEIPAEADLRRKWKINSGKALFSLRTSISKEYIEHVRDSTSPKDVWETLEKLFSRKNMARLQYLENELALTIQGTVSVEEYFLKIKHLCSEILELDKEEPVKDARLRRYLIRALTKQAASGNNQAYREEVLYSKEQMKSSFTKNLGDRKHSSKDEKQMSSAGACYRCGKLGHIKRANVVHESSGEQTKWEKCLSIEVSGEPLKTTYVVQPIDATASVNSSIDYTNEWIVDSVIVIADNSLHPVVKEGFYNEDNSDGVRLDDVYHVPGLKKNLASVSQITDSGRYVLFVPNNVQVLSNMNHISADVLLTGKRKEPLYVLSANEAYVEKTSKKG